MKKAVSLITAALMLMSCSTVFASSSAKDEKHASAEEILKSVKERIGSTAGYDRFTSTESEYLGEICYEFEWSSQSDGDSRYLSVTANTDGLITRLYSSGDYRESYSPSIGKPTAHEAAEKAKVLIDRLNPNLTGKLALTVSDGAESLFGSDYNFRISHFEQGLKISGDSGYVLYNADSDSLRSFSLSYTPSPELEPLSESISPDSARASFMENFGLKLIYRKVFDSDGKPRFIPVYIPNIPDNRYINANTNAVEAIIPILGGHNNLFTESTDEAAGGSSSSMKNDFLTEIEQSALDDIRGLLSKEKLTAIAKSNNFAPVTSSFALESYRMNHSADTDEYFARLIFSSSDEQSGYSYLSFTINARTGEITTLRSNAEYSTNAVKRNPNSAEKLAENIAKTFAGSKFSEYHKDDKSSPDDGIFVFTRYVNGIEAEGDTIRISIAPSGKLESYNCTYSLLAFPSLDGVISESAAGDALFAAVDYTPIYMPQAKSADSKEYDIYVPVFDLDPTVPHIVDATDGKILGYDGCEYTKYTIPEFSDVAGHYSETAVCELARYGILSADTAFHPDDEITQADFLAMLTKACGENGDTYSSAKRMGIITESEVAPDSTVSRMSAANFLVRALGIEEYASLDGIFVKPFPDIVSNYGTVAILGAMGIFRGDENGHFNPDASLLRGDAATLIYNWLSK